MQPTNYSGMLNPVDPGQALLSGIKTGAVIGEVQQMNQQRELQQQQLAQQKADLGALVNNPTPTAQDYANYTLKYPSQAEAAGKAFTLLDTAQQQQKIGVASRVYGALQSGRPDLADQILAEQETAQSNGGNPGDLQATKVLRQLVQTDPNAATHTAGLFLSSVMGPKNFAGAFGQIAGAENQRANQPLQTAKTQAEIGNLKSQVDTRTADLEIKRTDTQIKALNAKLKGETNDIERQKLKGQIDDAQTRRDQLAADKNASGQSGISAIDNALDTISRVKTAPGLSKTVGLTGAIPNIPGSEASNAQALIDQLQSQSFLASIQSMKGLGALSDAEGAKITNSIASLNTKQDEAQFRRQLDSIEKQFNTARERLAKQHSMEVQPHQGVIMSVPGYGDITQERVNAAAKKAGITPEALLEKLRAQGAQ